MQQAHTKRALKPTIEGLRARADVWLDATAHRYLSMGTKARESVGVFVFIVRDRGVIEFLKSRRHNRYSPYRPLRRPAL